MPKDYPYTAAQIEALFSRYAGSTPLVSKSSIGYKKISEKQLTKTLYPNPKGPLKELISNLKAEAEKLNDSNYGDTVLEWMAIFLHGVMTCDVDKTGIVDVSLDRYRRIVQKYSRLIHRAFATESVSDIDNYENLEFLGDGVYKNALVFYFWRECKLYNKSAVSTIKHTHENMKALSDLAKMFSMIPFVVHKNDKHVDGIYEDVFEAVMGVFQIIQWDIQQDPGSKEFIPFSADSGFANRLVRLIFKNTDVILEGKVAHKTLFTTLSWQFAEGNSRLTTSAKESENHLYITVSAPRLVVMKIAQAFNVSYNELNGICNRRYDSDSDAHPQWFSSVVHEDIMTSLAKLGITEQAIHELKTLKSVPGHLAGALKTIFKSANAKGYWVGINKDISINSHQNIVLKGVLYHSNMFQPVQHKTISGPKHLIEDLYLKLFAKIKKMIEIAPPIKTKRKKTIAAVSEKALETLSIKKLGDESAHSIKWISDASKNHPTIKPKTVPKPIPKDVNDKFKKMCAERHFEPVDQQDFKTIVENQIDLDHFKVVLKATPDINGIASLVPLQNDTWSIVWLTASLKIETDNQVPPEWNPV